jgi:hypothetical protein
MRLRPALALRRAPLDDCRAIAKDRSRVETQLLVAHRNRAKVLAGEPLAANWRRPANGQLRGDRVVSEVRAQASAGSMGSGSL